MFIRNETAEWTNDFQALTQPRFLSASLLGWENLTNHEDFDIFLNQTLKRMKQKKIFSELSSVINIIFSTKRA